MFLQNAVHKKHRFVVRLEDIWKNLTFDLRYGFSRIGSTLVKSLVEVTQGSPLSPGVADLVLQVIETKNKNICCREWRHWKVLVLRWVDDIYVAMVCVQITKSTTDLRLRYRLSPEQFADKYFVKFVVPTLNPDMVWKKNVQICLRALLSNCMIASLLLALSSQISF